MNLSSIVQTNVLEELKKGNTEVLKRMPPVVAMQYGLALQNEVGQVQDSPINDEALGKSMLKLMEKSKKVTD
jgi:hypothetical protein